MRTADIAELCNHLTQYLQESSSGQEIVVRDRQRPIAKIVPFTVDEDDAEDAALVAAGLMRKGTRTVHPSFWRARRSRVSVKAAVAAVGADRDEVLTMAFWDASAIASLCCSQPATAQGRRATARVEADGRVVGDLHRGSERVREYSFATAI